MYDVIKKLFWQLAQARGVSAHQTEKPFRAEQTVSNKHFMASGSDKSISTEIAFSQERLENRVLEPL